MNRELILQLSQQFADEEMASAKYICRVCSIRPAVTVHEISPKSMGGEWWVPANRIAVCHKCHDRIHREGTATWSARLLAYKKQL